MMTVDMTKIQVGDTVHFRCGGSAVVTKVLSGVRYGYVTLLYEEGDFQQAVTRDGVIIEGRRHIFDIIRITPRALTPEERLEKIRLLCGNVDIKSHQQCVGAIADIYGLARGEP